jgi:membrane protein DedA with SNARE-associated domain
MLSDVEIFLQLENHAGLVSIRMGRYNGQAKNRAATVAQRTYKEPHNFQTAHSYADKTGIWATVAARFFACPLLHELSI